MNGQPQRSWLWRMLQVPARILTTLLFDLKVYGVRNVPPRGGVLLLANHQSYLDPVLIAVRLNRPVSFMGKSELFEGGGFFPWLIRTLHAFPVKQRQGDVGAIKEAIRRLQAGHIVNIYPEGTRTQDGQIGPILPGIALIARRAGVPVIPVAIDGSFQSWPHWRKMFRPYPVRMIYGRPLKLSGLQSEQITELIGLTLRNMLTELRSGRVSFG